MTISGNNLFAAGRDSSLNPIIGEYTTSGATVNANLIPGVPNGINGIVVNGNNMFVANISGTIAEYSISGALINPSFITGLNSPVGLNPQRK